MQPLWVEEFVSIAQCAQKKAELPIPLQIDNYQLHGTWTLRLRKGPYFPLTFVTEDLLLGRPLKFD